MTPGGLPVGPEPGDTGSEVVGADATPSEEVNDQGATSGGVVLPFRSSVDEVGVPEQGIAFLAWKE